MDKILVYLHIIHLLNSSTCFKHCPAHLQEVYVVIVYMQPLVYVTIPEAAYTQLRRRPPEDEQGNAWNMCRSLINELYVNKQEFCPSSWRSNQGYTLEYYYDARTHERLKKIITIEHRISHKNTNVYHACGGSKFLCNVGTHPPKYTVSLSKFQLFFSIKDIILYPSLWHLCVSINSFPCITYFLLNGSTKICACRE
jgi:hypothetical protein